MLAGRFMSRAERAVSAFGLATALVVLIATIASISWVHYERHTSRRAAQESNAARTAELIARASEALIERNELSTMRRLIQETAALPGLAGARVILANGAIAADANPDRITPGLLPERWDGLGIDAADLVIGPDGRVARVPMLIPGRGDATLELLLAPHDRAFAATDIPLGVAASGAAALAGLLLLYRRMRARIRIYTAIGAALSQARRGDRAPDALGVSASLGEEAIAWNTLVAEREDLRRQLATGAIGGAQRAGGPSRTALQNACDALSQGLLVIDDTLHIKYANGAASVLLRATPERVLGAAVDSGLLPEQVAKMVRAVAGGETRRRLVLELDQSDDASRSVLRFGVRPVRHEDSGAAMILIEDITQQKAADEARQSFVAHAAHELRTPLTNVKLYVDEAIAAGDTDTATRSRALNVINEEAMRLERIVGDMLCVSEMEAATFRLRTDDVNAEEILTSIETEFRPLAEAKGIGLVFERPPKYPQLRGDRDKISLALHNLVGNAVKYTPAGGQVRVKASAEADTLRFEVVDNGIGIATEEQDLIFERFYRAKDARVTDQTGSGLGLTLARQVVRLHGGEISVQSEKDRGSRFTMTLPLTGEAA